MKKRVLKKKFAEEKEKFENKIEQQQNTLVLLTIKHKKFTKKLQYINEKLALLNIDNNVYRKLRNVFLSWKNIYSREKESLNIIYKLIQRNLLEVGLSKIFQKVERNQRNERKNYLFLKLLKNFRRNFIKQSLKKWLIGAKLIKLSVIKVKNQQIFQEKLQVNLSIKALDMNLAQNVLDEKRFQLKRSLFQMWKTKSRQKVIAKDLSKCFIKAWDKKKKLLILRTLSQRAKFFKRLKNEFDKYTFEKKNNILSRNFDKMKNQYDVISKFKIQMVKISRKIYHRHKRQCFLDVKVYAIQCKVMNY